MTRRLAAWIGILAVALQALWPLVAAARPAATVLVPVCTVDGVTHYYEVPAPGTPLEQRSASHHEHCAFCLFGAAVASEHISVPSPRGQHNPVTTWKTASLPPHPQLAQPRAPPFLPYVEWAITDYRRNHAENFLPAARRADPGVRVLRRIVLHD